MVTAPSAHPQTTAVQEEADHSASQDSNSDIVARTPPSKSSIINSSVVSTPAMNHATPVPVSVPAHNLSAVSASSVLPGSTSVRGALENAAAPYPSSLATLASSVKEEDVPGFPSRRPSPALSDTGLARGIARGCLSSLPSSSIPLSSSTVPSNGALSPVSSPSEITKMNLLTDDRLVSSGMVQPLASPLSNRLNLTPASKSNDATGLVDSSNANDTAPIGGRVFSPSLSPGMLWRPGSPFPKQNKPGQFRARTEIPPDQREKLLQRFQQVQQNTHNTLLSMPPHASGNHKQFSAQSNPLLQQMTADQL